MNTKLVCIFSWASILFLTVYKVSANHAILSRKAIYTGSFSGVALNNKDSLRIMFWKDYIIGALPGEAFTLMVPIDKKGKFHFSLPAFDHPGRMTIFFKINTGMVQTLVEPGDTIHIHFTMGEWELIPAFSGKNSIKYSVAYGIRAPPTYTFGSNDPLTILDSASKEIYSKNKFIESHSEDFNRTIFNIFKADVVGMVYGRVYDCIYYMDSLHQNAWKNFSEEEIRAEDLHPDIDNEGFYSSEYVRYQQRLAMVRLTLKKGKNILFEEVYFHIRERLTGRLREKVLALHLLNRIEISLSFSGADPNAYARCFGDCIGLVKTPFILQRLLAEQKMVVKGAVIENFSLPDTTGKAVQLSDFLGKVILLDIWGFNCGGCVRFDYYFKKNVYPYFQNNKDFVVISVADTWRKNLWMNEIPKYSDHRFVNLTTENKKNSLSKYYENNPFPFTMLIDRKGRLYSSTLPDPEQESSVFKELILQALAEQQ